MCFFATPASAFAVTPGASVVHDSASHSINNTYRLDGIQYQVYTNADCASDHKATDVNGVNAVLTVHYDESTGRATTNKVELRPGTYYVKEVEGSVTGTGFTVDGTVYTARVTSNNTQANPLTLTSTEDVVRISNGTIRKLDSVFGGTPAGDGTLGGCVIRVRYFDDPDTTHDSEWYKGHAGQAKATWYFETDGNGEISFANSPLADGYSSSAFKVANGRRVFLLGAYLMDEVKAPEGYKLAENLSLVRLTQASTSSIAPDGSLEFTATDEIEGERIVMEKRDAEVASGQATAGEQMPGAQVEYLAGGAAPSATYTQGDTDHSSTYRVQNISDHAIQYVTSDGDHVVVDKDAYLPETFTCEVDGDGRWVTPTIHVSYGTYRITETAAGEGLKVNREWTQVVEAHSPSETPYAYVQLNEPIRAGLGLVKVDSATMDGDHAISNGHSIATIMGDVMQGQGDARLDGAEFTIRNVSRNAVLVDGKWYARGADICKIVTFVDEDGHVVAYTKTNVDLPYGTYEVRETKAPVGYELGEGLVGGSAIILHPSEAADGSWRFMGWAV